MRLSRRPRRRGMTLLEVITALAIFLLAMVVFSQIITLGTDTALETQFRGEAAEKCASKLNEVLIGAIPLSSQSDVPFEDDPNWTWSLDAEEGNVANLWNVTVHVSRQRGSGQRMEYCALNQMVLDPSVRGSSFDTIAVSNSGAAAPASGSGATGQAAQGAAAGGGGMSAPVGGAAGSGARPAAGGGGAMPPGAGGAPAGRPVGGAAPPGGIGGPGGGPRGGGAPGGGGGGPRGGGAPGAGGRPGG
jgi:prepilin-type N-terminal cleavage/methylation domain-containing protein